MPVAEPGDPDRVLEPPLWEQLAAKSAELPQGERLQKVLAVRGWGSRRVCEDMISDGRATVNGATAVLGRRVDTDHDLVEVDGVPIGVKPGLVYYLLNKPEGVVTTAHDPQGRRTVVQIVPAEPRVYPVGRLDVATEGLLLLTNDGDLAHRLAHPSHGVEKEYLAEVDGAPGGEPCAAFATASSWTTASPRRQRCRSPARVCCASPFTKVAIGRCGACARPSVIPCTDWCACASGRCAMPSSSRGSGELSQAEVRSLVESAAGDTRPIR